MKHQAKAITREEAQYIFIKYLVETAQYWADESRQPEGKAKCSGTVFSSLVCLDGGAMGPPGYELQAKLEGTISGSPEQYGDDFGGALHEHFYQYMDEDYCCKDNPPRHKFLLEMARVAKRYANSDMSDDQKCKATLSDFLLVLDGKAGIDRPKIVPCSGAEGDIEYAQEEGYDYYPLVGEDIGGDLYSLVHRMILGEWKKPDGLYDSGEHMIDEAKSKGYL